MAAAEMERLCADVARLQRELAEAHDETERFRDEAAVTCVHAFACASCVRVCTHARVCAVVWCCVRL